jgi:hypothetical protein
MALATSVLFSILISGKNKLLVEKKTTITGQEYFINH